MNHIASFKHYQKSKYQTPFLSLPQSTYSIAIITTCFALAFCCVIDFPADHLKHFFVSSALMIVFYQIFSFLSFRGFLATLGALTLGIFKEGSDPVFDITDIAANCGGVTFGVLIILFYVLTKN